jgi:transposase
VVADCGNDSDQLVAALTALGTQAVIPHRRKRRHLQAYEAACYTQQHPVERLFSRIKQFRQYDKLEAHFLALIHLAATIMWMRDC